jgi:branched-chain amino acid transport system substrate-binding protein
MEGIMKAGRRAAVVIAVLVFLFNSISAVAETGVTDKEIVIGMSTALTGPSSFLGINFKAGVEAYLGLVNAQGGVEKRKIRLIVYDDRYEPTNTKDNVKKLLNEDKVFCLLGNVGTPTTLAIKPILDEHKVPLFAPFTGAESLRHPVDRYLFHYRASYNQEAETFIQGMVDVLGYQKIGVFYQDDGYGKAVLDGTKQALERRHLKPVSLGAYTRNYEDVVPAVESIMAGKPQAVVMAGTYSACSKFIRTWKRTAILEGRTSARDIVFINVSFVGPERLASLLENYGSGVVTTQVVPSFSKGATNLPAVNEYLEALRIYAPGNLPSYGSLEGYLATKVFVEILKRAGRDVTRESFIQTAESVKDLDIQAGNKINFSSTNHQGSQDVYPTVFRNGVFVPLTDWRAIKLP